MEKQAHRLYSAQQAHGLITGLWPHIKAYLMAGHRLTLEVRPETRSLDQNAKFHAICADLERSKLPWAGASRSASQWKVLLISGHAVATKQGAQIIPGLEGEFVNIRESSALMTKSRGSSLIEYCISFCAQNNVCLSE